MTTPAYNCLDCLGWCCSVYEKVEVTKKDLKRIGEHFKMSDAAVLRQFTRETSDGKVLLKRKADTAFKEVCILFDTEKRRCRAYEGRPQVCRDWPHPAHRLPGAEDRCCYYDLYKFMQNELATNVLPLIQIKRVIK
jgi:Fe-S-cluster containining protein